MRVTWHRSSSSSLQLPPVCPVTGERATTTVRLLLRSLSRAFQPRAIRAFTGDPGKPVSLVVPVSATVRHYITRRRRGLVAAAVAAVVLALLGGVVGLVDETVGLIIQCVAAVAVIVFLVVLVVVTVQLDVVKSEVNGDWISMTQVHPAFAAAFIAANAAGTVTSQDDPSREPHR